MSYKKITPAEYDQIKKFVLDNHKTMPIMEMVRTNGFYRAVYIKAANELNVKLIYKSKYCQLDNNQVLDIIKEHQDNANNISHLAKLTGLHYHTIVNACAILNYDIKKHLSTSKKKLAAKRAIALIQNYNKDLQTLHNLTGFSIKKITTILKSLSLR